MEVPLWELLTMHRPAAGITKVCSSKTTSNLETLQM